MSDHSGLYNYYKRNYHYDLAMRTAFEGDTEKFEEAAKRINDMKSKDTPSLYSSEEMAAAVIFQIFAAHSDKAGMKAYSEVFGDLSVDRHFGVKMPAKICLVSNLTAACIAGDDSLAEQAAFDCGRELSDFVIYILMLCRKFNVLRKIFPLLDKNSSYRQYDPKLSLFDIPLFAALFVSAAVFKDREALETFLDLGCCPSEIYFYMLSPFPEAIDFLAENYYKYLGFDRPPCFDELFGGENDGVKLTMMYGIFSCNSVDVFEKYAKKISPVKTVPSDLLHLCRQGLESENGEVFGRILSDNLTVVLNSHNIAYVFQFAETFGGNVKIDLSQAAGINGFSELSVSQLIKLLKDSIISPEICMLCPFTAALLMKNSSRLTAAMISKGLINLENLRETVGFITDKKLLNALNAVNNAEQLRGRES